MKKKMIRKPVLCTVGTVNEFLSELEKRITELKSVDSATNSTNISANPSVTPIEGVGEVYTRDEYIDMLESAIEDELYSYTDPEFENVVVDFREGPVFIIVITAPEYGTVRVEITDDDLGFTVDSLNDDTLNIVDIIVNYVETGEIPD